MHLEWYEWLILVAWSLSLGWSALWVGMQIPNGELVVWHRHRKVIEGHKYVVRSLYFECLSTGVSGQRCAVLQDEFGVEKPFHVYFPPESECQVVVGQLVQPIWRNSTTYILFSIPINSPVYAC